MDQTRRSAAGSVGARRLTPAMSLLRAAATPEWLLRASLGIIYLWFGALKLLQMSPVLDLVRRAYPPLGALPLFLGLGLFEVALGLALLGGLGKPWTAAAVVFHLVSTFGVLVFSPQLAFAPQFPCLTMTGEFVVKNLVLLAAAGVLWQLWREAGQELAVPSPLPRR
jgi:putative oxidoreductase